MTANLSLWSVIPNESSLGKIGHNEKGRKPYIFKVIIIVYKVFTSEGGICYINLSNDFIIKNTGSPEIIKLNIYSVVNSLTEVSGVKKVQFLIEAEKVDNLKQSIDLSNPIERDESYIQKEKQ